MERELAAESGRAGDTCRRRLISRARSWRWGLESRGDDGLGSGWKNLREEMKCLSFLLRGRRGLGGGLVVWEEK
ncbi:unnamed protein product [Linum trigynum]|uniref:Uncharacterized protein n=1 Tax=Linum trigynum TaxID=586398 RepID=A0AAV2DID2_9ROSI